MVAVVSADTALYHKLMDWPAQRARCKERRLLVKGSSYGDSLSYNSP
jgi:hypothetical protein